VLRTRSNGAITAGILAAVFFWGGNNVGVKYMVVFWPPVFLGCTRFLCAGFLLLAVLQWTTWLGEYIPPTPQMRRELWWRGGLSLAANVVAFNFATRFTAVSHVALYMAASPVWALIWEGRAALTWRLAQRYLSAGLALVGVVVLFWPSLHAPSTRWLGELLGLGASLAWTNYVRQCRAIGTTLSGVEMTAHTMWRAGVILTPFAAAEVMTHGLVYRADVALIQTYCILAGGVGAYVLWNNALEHWPASKALLFNNLIPLCVMGWAHVLLGEQFTPTFWLSMLLIVGGVLLGQANWQRILGGRWFPVD